MKKILVFLFILLLAGCDKKTEIFGVELGGPLQVIRDKNLVAKEDIIPSSHHYLMLELSEAPKNEMDDTAKYSVSALDEIIIGISAEIDDTGGDYFPSMVSYAQRLLGEPLATEKGIKDHELAALTPYQCIANNSCPRGKYAIFRNGDINAMVSYGGGKSTLQFDSDKIKDAINIK